MWQNGRRACRKACWFESRRPDQYFPLVQQEERAVLVREIVVRTHGGKPYGRDDLAEVAKSRAYVESGHPARGALFHARKGDLHMPRTGRDSPRMGREGAGMAEEDKSLENGEGGGEPKDWKAEARKWESRAKANFEKAKAYDEAQEAGKSEREKARAKAEKLDGELKAMKAKAERDALVAKVAKETGGIIPAHAGNTIQG